MNLAIGCQHFVSPARFRAQAETCRCAIEVHATSRSHEKTACFQEVTPMHFTPHRFYSTHSICKWCPGGKFDPALKWSWENEDD